VTGNCLHDRNVFEARDIKYVQINSRRHQGSDIYNRLWPQKEE
jgi:hypothetical protein